MRRFLIVVLVLLVVLVPAAWWFLGTPNGRSAQFVVGGALVNLGYRMQDHLEAYDFDAEHAHGASMTPQEVWTEVMRQNRLASGVRRTFPRTHHHPLVALVACMDARLDTNEITGDTRQYYYVIRTAGSVLEDKEAEMLELAVQNGVKVILLTTHSDCAAERTAADPQLQERYPTLVRAVHERGMRLRALLARPFLADRIAKGELLVKQMNIDTRSEELAPK